MSTTTPAAKKPAKRSKKRASRLILADELPPAAQAASMAITLCKAAKVDTFTELEEKVKAGDEKVLAALSSIKLSPEQVDIIAQNMFAVRAVGANPPMRTVVVCHECNAVLVVSGGAAPKRCTLTRNCTGTTSRASAAARRELVEDKE